MAENRGQRRVGEAWWALERAIADDPGPDMLEALAAVTEYAKDCASELDERPPCLISADAAIAKATAQG